MIDFDGWTKATTDLPWGAQKVLHDTLSLVAEGKVNLTWGADYKDGTPCLINAAATMLSSNKGEGGGGIPGRHFPGIVSNFDAINRALHEKGVNPEYKKVSPLAAEILVANFGVLKEQPIEEAVNEATSTAAFETGAYREPSDAELTREWLTALSEDAVPEPTAVEEVSEQDERDYADLFLNEPRGN